MPSDLSLYLPPPPPVRLNRPAPATMSTSRKALAKVSSIAHTTKEFTAPKLHSAASSIRSYSNSASGWRDEPGVITTPKKVQKGKQAQVEADYSMYGSGMPSPSTASRWSGIGSYFSSGASSASMSGSSTSGTTIRPEDLEEEKVVLFPGVRRISYLFARECSPYSHNRVTSGLPYNLHKIQRSSQLLYERTIVARSRKSR